MAKRNYKQYVILAVLAVFIIVAVANYNPSMSGHIVEQSTRYDVTEYICSWGEGSYGTSGGWHWIGRTHDYTWTLGSYITPTEAYCKEGVWKCMLGDEDLGEIVECDYKTEGAVCTCAR